MDKDTAHPSDSRYDDPEMAEMEPIPEQDTLFATGKIEFKEISVKLDTLSKSFIGRLPSDAMIESVKKFGVLQPILLTKSPAGGVLVAAGRRRVLAARAAKLTQIPARMITVQGGWLDAQEVITIAENRYRDGNPAAEVAAVRDLILRGHSAATIQRELGMSARQFAPIADLMSVNPEIFTGFTQGKVKVGVARRVAKLPANVQKQLALRLAEKGALRHRDVDGAMPRVVQQEMPRADDQGGLESPELTGVDIGELLSGASLTDLLRAAQARATSNDTLRFILARAIKIADEDDHARDEPTALGDREGDEPFQGDDGELSSDGEDSYELVATSTEPA